MRRQATGNAKTDQAVRSLQRAFDKVRGTVAIACSDHREKTRGARNPRFGRKPRGAQHRRRKIHEQIFPRIRVGGGDCYYREPFFDKSERSASLPAAASTRFWQGLPAPKNTGRRNAGFTGRTEPAANLLLRIGDSGREPITGNTLGNRDSAKRRRVENRLR